MTVTTRKYRPLGIAAALIPSLLLTVACGTAGTSTEPVAADDSGCDVSAAHGSYAATGRGTAVGRGPLAAVGVLTFDGKGGFTAVRTIHNGPQVHPDHTVKGSYTINADCTGSLSYSNGDGISGAQTTHNDLVVDDNGNQLRVVGTDPGFAVIVEGRRQFIDTEPGSCSTSTLTGRYGATGSGVTADGKPLAAVGVLEFDGAGAFTVTRSISLNGEIIPKQTIEGTYTLDADCTGSVEYVADGIPVGEIKRNYIVVGDDGRELRAVGLDPNLLDTILAYQQEPRR
ncbi:hypothetical protein [Nocardia cyriacigeorgica]|uniref:hypothetical protein n=1 Tax=Nocardia cyriacigeorgica TaxID=135487 RepID=UPI00189426CA|nr:hypothetical protein [Nocardia cyriacigeorgica]MBF6095666.1 hypothetical protein [Nocardia cyriacigeorgica]